MHIVYIATHNGSPQWLIYILSVCECIRDKTKGTHCSGYYTPDASFNAVLCGFAQIRTVA